MDKERIPRWGWLLLGLALASLVANAFTLAVLDPAGLEAEFQIIPVITAMSPVLIYVGVWYDEDRQHYWEYPTARIVGDLVFVLLGAVIGATLMLAVLLEVGLRGVLQDILTMGSGFALSWGLFWWRNPDLYRTGSDSE